MFHNRMRYCNSLKTESFNIMPGNIFTFSLTVFVSSHYVSADPIGFHNVAYPTNIAREENIPQGMNNHLLICLVCELST